MTREEAINEIKSWDFLEGKEIEAIHTLIPELTESEDEKIGKILIELVSNDKAAGYTGFYEERGITCDDAIAYLKKQKEQKTTPDWMPKFLDELRSKKNYFDWDEHRDIEGHILAIINWIAPDYFNVKEKVQKPILEVFGFKVGDAVRLKDGDGRKHIIKSFEEVEGLHGPNFYHVEFEDNSARDGIYPGEEYPNGYFTCMEKIDEQKEQKPEEKPINWTELTWEDINELEDIINKVHYEFRNGIGQESFGKEVLEQFREYKGDEYLDEIEQKPAEWGKEDDALLKEIVSFFKDGTVKL